MQKNHKAKANNIVERMIGKSKIQIIDYSETQFTEKETTNVEDCFPFKDTATVTWLNVIGLHTDTLKALGTRFNIHPLILEDIADVDQRPKLEDFETHMFIALKMVHYDEKRKEVILEHVSLIIGPNFVISFQEEEGDVFDPIRNKIRNDKGRIRKMGTDYLGYALIDAVVDNYFPILESMGDQIEEMENQLINKPTTQTLNVIHRLKRELTFLRKTIWPLREVIATILRSESKVIKKATMVYMRDVYDHTIAVIDTVETLRDTISGMLDIYLSSMSNRMNEVMKTLTIIATIFIPLTFIVGIYGMNFDYMPELRMKYGYAGVWIVMLIAVSIMMVYFKRKKWI